MSTDEAPGVRAHAIWLDVAHRLLTIHGGPFGVDVPAGERPLAVLAAAAQERAPEVPLGVRVVGGDAWCVVVDPTLRDGERVPLRTWEYFRLLRVFQRAG